MKNQSNTSIRIPYIILSILLVINIVLLFMQYREKNKYLSYLSNHYELSFNQVSDYLDNVSTMLTSVRLAKISEQSTPIFANIWKQSGIARVALANLPYSEQVMPNALNYLSQVSDFSYTMMLKGLEGSELTNADWKQVEQLRDYSNNFSKDMTNLIYTNNLGRKMAWQRTSNQNFEDFLEDIPQSNILGSMIAITKPFQTYPKLSYDGVFSDHIKDIQPELLQSKEEITKEQALKIAEEFLESYDIEEIKYDGTNDEEASYKIPSFSFKAILKDKPLSSTENTLAVKTEFIQDKPKDSIYIDISKIGGYVLWMINERQIQATELENALIAQEGDHLIQKVINVGEEFLSKKGFSNMVYSYYEIYDNYITINYVKREDDILIYSDLIKLKINLLDETILGYEGTNYIMMHKERQNISFAMSEETVKQFVSPQFKIENVKKVLLPLDTKEEAACYEFEGSFDGSKYLIYINSISGKQEKILELIK